MEASAAAAGAASKRRRESDVHDDCAGDERGGARARPANQAANQQISLKCDTHPGALMRGLGELLREEHLCDVVLRVDGVDFQAHRVVMAASSEMLRALLVGGWRESDEKVVRLEGVDANSFRTILNFIYTGRVVAHDVSELLHLLVASEHLGVGSVRDLCVQRLQQRLDLPNAIQMRIFAQKVGCVELEEAASEVVWGQFSQVVAAGSDFLSLSADQLSEVLDSDKLAVDSEEEVYCSLLKWVTHDEPRRVKDLPRLLAHVRLPMLPPPVLEGVERNPMVAEVFRSHAANRALLDEAKAYHRRKQDEILRAARDAEAVAVASAEGLGDEGAAAGSAGPAEQGGGAAKAEPHLPLAAPLPQEPSSRAMMQRPQRVGKALFALGGRPAWTRVEKYDIKDNRWTEMSPMRQMRMRHGSATIGGLIYVVGGKDEKGRALAHVERYNPHMDVWETLPPMKTARTGVGVGVLAGVLYAVGGRHDSGYRLKTVECFNVQTNEWHSCPSMSMPRGALRVASLEGCLYVVGGRSESGNAINSVERYSPLDEKWTSVAPLTTARVGAGLDVLGGRLYAIGGKDQNGSKLRSVEGYDPKTDKWEACAPMGTKRWGAGVAVMDGKLYVIGGMNGAERGALPTVEVYDQATDSWSELSPGPNLARGSCTFAAA